MLNARELKPYRIYQELEEAQKEYWFSYRQRKFLHNIDTFYYSVKLQNDFRSDTSDWDVLSFRRRFESLQANMKYDDSLLFYVPGVGNMNLLNFRYGKYYDICLECPEYFHVFFASKVPPGAGNSESLRLSSRSAATCCGCTASMNPSSAPCAMSRAWLTCSI